MGENEILKRKNSKTTYYGWKLICEHIVTAWPATILCASVHMQINMHDPTNQSTASHAIHNATQLMQPDFEQAFKNYFQP